MSQSPQITSLLQQFHRGEPNSWAQLVEMAYPQLHQIVHRLIRRDFPKSQEQPTELLHELSIRLLRRSARPWLNREHFFRSFAKIARLRLLHRIRTQRRRAELSQLLQPVANPQIPDASQIQRAIDQLAALDPRQAKIVSLIYVSGLTELETANQLGLSGRTVRRELASARLWLRSQLECSA